jgi:hypothetical protein
MEHHFNVYDYKWNFIDEFWSGTDRKMKIGDYEKIKANKLYQLKSKDLKNKIIIIKRMS